MPKGIDADGLEALDAVIKNSAVGGSERLSEEAISKLLAQLLFEATNRSDNRLVEVRDYKDISEKGPFKYSGQTQTMYDEGLMPEEVYTKLKSLGIDRHVGPSYLRVKGLLTHHEIRKIFGKQMTFAIQEQLRAKKPDKPGGFVVCIPNMTGGAWIGDETARLLGDTLKEEYNVFPATPYARETRKPIDAIKNDAKFADFVEGLMPSPSTTSVIICFEELRTAAETTQNATNMYRKFGYNESNGVKIIEACVFDYGHPVGVERLNRLAVDRVYLVGGSAFMDLSRDLGYLSDTKHAAAIDWLRDPWEFTRKILPDIERLYKK